MKPIFVETRNYQRFMEGLDALDARGSEECRLVVVDGLPGLGKTTILARWAAQESCLYLRAKTEWTAYWMMAELLAEATVTPPHGHEARFRACIAMLRERMGLGRRGGSGSIKGQNSPYGTGGNGAYTSNGGISGTTITNPPTAGTGYGAGGGGPLGGKGGGAGQTVTVAGYDISGLASPNLTITIGARDTGGSGALGSAGMVKVKTSTQALVPAGVIPFAPTATGTFTKGAGAAGVGTTIFPDFGNQKGLWTIHANSGAAVLGMTVKIDSAGTLHALTSLYGFTFVSDIRPEITASDGTSRTIKYSFYRMNVD